MGLFGRDTNNDTELTAIIEGLGEEVQQKALVQYHPSDSRARPLWGLLVLTRSALHIIYGQSENWATRMIQSSRIEQQTITIPRDTIDGLELPPAPTGIRRLFANPTRMVTVRTTDDDEFRLEIGDDGEHLLRTLIQ